MAKSRMTPRFLVCTLEASYSNGDSWGNGSSFACRVILISIIYPKQRAKMEVRYISLDAQKKGESVNKYLNIINIGGT